MAMATLQWAAPVDNSLWAKIKHTAGVVYQRSGAYLTGQYQYIFHNQTCWTVKLHLTDDLAQAGIAGEAGGAQGYFLTLPAGAHNVEIPMKSSLVTINGGFFHPDKGCYEIFWDRRRFAWSPAVCVSVQQRHSNEANVFRGDVSPGAPLVVQLPHVHEEFAIFTPRHGCTKASAADLQIAYSCHEGQWKSAVVTEVLPGGLLQLEDGTSRWTLQPTLQPTLVPCGPVEESQPEAGGEAVGTDEVAGDVVGRQAFAAAFGSLAAGLDTEDLQRLQAEAVARERQHDEELAAAEELAKAAAAEVAEVAKMVAAAEGRSSADEESSGPVGEASAAQSTMSSNSSGETFTPGQSLHVYSNSQAAWVQAEVTKVLADGSVTLQYAACKSLKTVRPEDQPKLLKTM